MKLLTLVGALALGAGAMYYMDPQQGRRRRALVGDKVDSMSHDARNYLEGRRKHASDRVRGLAARVRNRFSAEAPSDQQLYGKVRSRLGRTVSYPHAVETDVQQGRVLLRGDILEGEFNALMSEIWSMRGIKSIDSQMNIHAEPGLVSTLQGTPHRTRRAQARYFARNAATLVAIAGGVAAVVKALRTEGSATGMVSLATTLLTLGMGDGAQRMVHRRRSTVANQRMQPSSEIRIERPPERLEEGTPALLQPGAAVH